MGIRTSDCREYIDLSEAVINKADKTVEVTLIKKGWSSNGRNYSDAVLMAAAPKWQDVRAYIDHPTKSQMKDQPGRSVMEIAGIYSNPHHENGQTRATMRLIGPQGDAVWPLIVETVESGVPLIGLSINALGKTRKGEVDGQKGYIVEDIVHANSVDIVTQPAAGGGFDALVMSDDGWTSAVLENITEDELREARPDIIEGFKREWKTVRDTAALETAREEITALEASVQASKAEVDRLNQHNQALISEVNEAQVDRLLSSITLPDEWKVSLKHDLMEAPKEAWMEIVTREEVKAKSIPVKVNRPVKVTGAGALGQTSTRQTIAESANSLQPNSTESVQEWQKRTSKLKQQRN